MQTGSSVTLIGWISGQTTFVPLWDRMEGAWLRTLGGSPMVLSYFILRFSVRNMSYRVGSKIDILLSISRDVLIIKY